MIVADTNLVAYLLIEGERTAQARRAWERDPAWIVPPLWRSEYLSVLVKSVSARVLTEDQAAIGWQRGITLMRGREREPMGSDVLHTAIRRGLPAYDAQFVVLAETLAAPLVTSDRKILKACPDVAVSLDAFAAKR